MSALDISAAQLATLNPTGAPTASSVADLAHRGQIHQTAQKFEASFLTSMLGTMFQGVSTSAPFGGGPGEDIWKGFLAEAMAGQMSKRGGIGVSNAIEREMLKLQGLSEAHTQ
jgi:flagellar protein FlgJ